jgi:hypothetical protein
MVSLQTDSSTTQTLVDPQSPQKNVRVSVEVPVDSDGHEVMVIVSPKKPTYIINAPAYSEIELIAFNMTPSIVHSPVVIALNTTAPNPSPSAAFVYNSEEEDVFGQIRVVNRNEVGRKEKRWYVIKSG